MKNRRFSLFFYWILATSSGLLGQSPMQPDLVFRHLTERDGLTHNLVNCFLKDRNGLLWVGTYSGLNRFDGAHFLPFKHANDSVSLPQNTVHQLCEDRSGNIWGGTDEGIFCYDPTKNRFKSYKKTADGGKIMTYSIICDQDGAVWASGRPGFLKFDPIDNEFEQVQSGEQNFTLGSGIIHKHGIVEDPSGEGIWIGTSEGLYFFEKKTGRFLSVKNQPAGPIFTGHSLGPLALSSEPGRVWSFDYESSELLQFDRKGQVFQKIYLQKALPGFETATIFEDAQQRIWLSSWTSETAVIRYKAGIDIQKLVHDPAKPTTPAANFFWDAWQNDDGSIWLGTAEGISICHPERSFYKIHRFSEWLPDLFAHNFSIICVAENPRDGSWWISTDGFKLVRYDPKTGATKVIDTKKAPPFKKGHQPAFIRGIRFFGEKIFLFSGHGAWTFSEKTGQFERFSVDPPGVAEFRAQEGFFEGDSVGWFIDQTRMAHWDARSRTAQVIDFQQDTMPDGSKPSLASLCTKPDAEGNFWMVGGNRMLAFFEKKTGKLVPKLLSPDDLTERTGSFLQLHVDDFGKVWIAFPGQGLYGFDPKTGTATLRREVDGLLYENVRSVISDLKGRVWCGAYNKVSVFDPAENGFFNIDLSAQFRSAGYSDRQTRLANGHILTSIDGDIVEFFPEKIAAPVTPATPLLGLLKIGNYLKLLTNENRATLEADENTVGFQFGTLADPIFSPTEIFYKLDGVNPDWIAANGAAEVVFSNLSPGEYRFRLISKSKNGRFQSPERTMTLVVRHKFYQKKGFQIGLLLFAGLLGWLFSRNRQNEKRMRTKLERRAEALEKEKALVMYENLKQHLNPHFLFNSLTSLGSLIRIDPAQAGDFLDKMSRVYRYILKSRDQETVSLGQELAFVQLYIGLQKARFEDGLEVKIDVPEEFHHRKIAPVTLQNLVENAIKHNITDIESPLVIELFVDDDDYLVVRNSLRKRAFVETSNRQGLVNMVSLYNYLSERPLDISENDQFFIVKIPLL